MADTGAMTSSSATTKKASRVGKTNASMGSSGCSSIKVEWKQIKF